MPQPDVSYQSKWRRGYHFVTRQVTRDEHLPFHRQLVRPVSVSRLFPFCCHTGPAGSRLTCQSREPSSPLPYSAERATSSRKPGAVVFVMAVFLASISAAHRAAPTGTALASSKWHGTARTIRLTRVGEGEEDADEGDHLKERSNYAETVPRLSVSGSCPEKYKTHAEYGARCFFNQACFWDADHLFSWKYYTVLLVVPWSYRDAREKRRTRS